MSTIIQTNQLTKSYGKNRGIIDVTFSLSIPACAARRSSSSWAICAAASIRPM